MTLLIRFLPVLLELALLVYCLIDCIQTENDRVRNLPKWAWIVLILLFPLVGGIAWLIAGKPQKPRGSMPWRSTETAGFPEFERPDSDRRSIDEIDEQLRRDQERVDREHDEALRRWQEQQRAQDGDPGDGGTFRPETPPT